MVKKADYVTNNMTNEEYWQDRAEKTYLAGEKKALKTARHLESLYKETSNIITEKINAFYGKYAVEHEMTIDQARTFLANDDLLDFKSYLKKILAMGNKENFSDEEMAEFKRLYTKAKITRLEELEASIRFELDKLSISTITDIEDLLANT